MKKTTLLKSMLLLCALVVGSSNLWAADETITLDFETDAIPSGWTATRFAVCDNPISSTSATNGLYACKTDGTAQDHILKYNSLIKNVKSISVDAGKTSTNTNGTMQIEFSTDGETWGTTKAVTINRNSWTNTKLTLASATDGYVRITFSGTTAIKYIDNIVITYTPPAKTDPTITFNNGSVNVGKTLDVSTLFSSNSEGDVSYSITAGGSYATLLGTTLTGVAEGSVTVKASQEGTSLYNAAEKSATITVNPALILSSIAITTAPTKTTYKEGQTFDPTGMVVTATYTDTSTDDVTASCTFTPSGALSTSDTKVTVSYTENAVTKTADQAITVSAQSTSISITTDYEWLGVSSGSNLSSFPKEIDNDGLTITFDGSGNKTRGDDTYIRVYSGNTMKFTAPASHFIKSIVLTRSTASSNKWDNTFTSDEGTWDNSTKTWSCGDDNIEEVTLSSDGQKWISKIDVTLVPYVTISPAKEYTTLTHAKNLDFTSVSSNLKAYIATSVSAGSVQMTKVNKVPAGTGLVLVKSSGSSFKIPVFTSGADDMTGNKMVGSATATTAVAANGGYILSDGVFQPSSGGDLPAGKAYLNIAVSAHSLDLDFGNGEVTSISAITSEMQSDGVYFNLAGQRVAQPTKGLYIVNGKKVVLK